MRAASAVTHSTNNVNGTACALPIGCARTTHIGRATPSSQDRGHEDLRIARLEDDQEVCRGLSDLQRFGIEVWRGSDGEPLNIDVLLVLGVLVLGPMTHRLPFRMI